MAPIVHTKTEDKKIAIIPLIKLKTLKNVQKQKITMNVSASIIATTHAELSGPSRACVAANLSQAAVGEHLSGELTGANHRTGRDLTARQWLTD